MRKDTRVIVGITLIFLLAAAALFVWRQNHLAVSGQTVFSEAQDSAAAGEEQNPVQEEAGSEASAAESALPQQEKAVYVSGAVKHPGLYRFQGNARVADAVDALGGFRKNAATDSVNLARLLEDGEQIRVLTKKQAAAKEETAASVTQEDSASDLINLNHATAQELMTLPGIGEAKAELIINYRTENGLFEKTEDIMKISGIKEGVYNKIKDLITV